MEASNEDDAREREPLLSRSRAGSLSGDSIINGIASLEDGLDDANAVDKYLSFCQDHQVPPCGEALIRLQVGSTCLRIESCGATKAFGNLEMRALTHLLEQGESLTNIKVLDLSRCRLGAAGVLLVGRLMCHPKCCFEYVNLSCADVGAEGALAIAEGVRKLKTLEVLRMPSCGIGKEGGHILVQLLSEVVHEGQEGWEGMVGFSHNLRMLDLQNNLLGTEVSARLQELADEQDLEIILFGNRVLTEVLNSVTHGLGFTFSIAGTVLLGIGARGKPEHVKAAVGIYCASLMFLFLSSMLYHSFFALGATVNRIFQFFDHVAIYCLIAGTYTPFLIITFHGRTWAQTLLAVIWLLALAGSLLTLLYDGRHKVHVENCLYLIMGWIIAFFVKDVIAAIGMTGFYWLLAGGVLYTLGVPWFLKDGKTMGIPDHTIWHMFVLAAAVAHFLCIYWYVVIPDTEHAKIPRPEE